jgi:hypothetical protein
MACRRAFIEGPVEPVRPNGGSRHGWPAANPVEPCHRLGGDAAHGRADDRWDGVFDHLDTDRHPAF